MRENEYVCVFGERDRERVKEYSELIVCLCMLLREKMCVRVLKVSPTGFTL